MKSCIISLLGMAICATSAYGGVRGIAIIKNDGETLEFPNAGILNLTFHGNDAVFTAADYTALTIGGGEIAKIIPIEEVADTWSAVYNGNRVEVVNPYALQGVTTIIDGAYVYVTNPVVGEEYTFTLTGASEAGSFTYTGEYKTTLQLQGISLKSDNGAAIDIRCSKRIAVEVTGENTLADCTDGEQKACMYFKGHPEFSGGGSLTVSGNTSHAIASKEYMQLKKSFGKLNVAAAKNDGIHAGQYFQINGGEVSVRNVMGDGIQAEATSNASDENNGRMIIKGGYLDIEVSGNECDCVKADSLITISGGSLLLAASGATSKCIKAKGDMTISGGEITATVTGNGIVIDNASSAPALGPGGGQGGGGGWPPGGWDKEDKETSSPGCIKVSGNLWVTGGILTLTATGKGGKCINVDGDMLIGADDVDGPVITASTTGGVVTGSGENINGLPKAIKVYGNLTVDGGIVTCTTKQNGGEGIECKSYLTINNGLVLCQTYDDGINSAKKITINGGVVCARATNNDGMDCNGSEGFEFNGGIVLASGANRPEEGFDCDSYRFAINGGTIIGTGGATSTVTSASQPFASVSGVSITSGQYLSLRKSDGTVICSYKVPNSISATVVVSSPEFTNGTSYQLVRNSTSVVNPDATYFDGLFTIGGTLQGGTAQNITPRTK